MKKVNMFLCLQFFLAGLIGEDGKVSECPYNFINKVE